MVFSKWDYNETIPFNPLLGPIPMKQNRLSSDCCIVALFGWSKNEDFSFNHQINGNRVMFIQFLRSEVKPAKTKRIAGLLLVYYLSTGEMFVSYSYDQPMEILTTPAPQTYNVFMQRKFEKRLNMAKKEIHFPHLVDSIDSSVKFPSNKLMRENETS